MKNKALILTERHGLIVVNYQDYKPLTDSAVKDLSDMRSFTGECKLIAEFETNDKNEILVVKGNKIFLELDATILVRKSKDFIDRMIVQSFEIKDEIISVILKDHYNDKIFKASFIQLDKANNVTVVKREQPTENKSDSDLLVDVPLLSYNDLVNAFDLNEDEKENIRQLTIAKANSEILKLFTTIMS